MNIEWDYNYYQPWSDNEWLVDEMLAMLDKDITMHYCIVCLRTLKDICGQDSLEKSQTVSSFYLWTVLNGTTLD